MFGIGQEMILYASIINTIIGHICCSNQHPMQTLENNRRITRVLAALFALLAMRIQTLPAQSLPATGSVVLSNWILLNSSSVIDSFDPSNPFKSTDGLFDPAKRQMHGNVFIGNSIGSDLHNGYVYGNLFYSGPAIKNTENVQGAIATPFNAPVTSVTDPSWFDGTFVQYSGGANPPASGMFIANGTSDYPTRIKVVGDFTVPGGKKFSIASDTVADRYLTVWVTGKFTTSGSGRVNQGATAHVTWIVDKDINTSGDTYKNSSGKALNLSLNAAGAGKVTLTGGTTFIGTIDAPGRTLSISGTGGLSGGVFANTLTLGGGSVIHCDESLPAR